jgi:hypothetical protein
MLCGECVGGGVRVHRDAHVRFRQREVIQAPAVVQPLVRRNHDSLQALALVLALRERAGNVGPVEAEHRVRIVEHAQAARIEILRGSPDETRVRARKTDATLLITDHRGAERLDQRNASPPAVFIAAVSPDEHQGAASAFQNPVRDGDVGIRWLRRTGRGKAGHVRQRWRRAGQRALLQIDVEADVDWRLRFGARHQPAA